VRNIEIVNQILDNFNQEDNSENIMMFLKNLKEIKIELYEHVNNIEKLPYSTQNSSNLFREKNIDMLLNEKLHFIKNKIDSILL
jgi:hypothetical protein